MSPKEPEKYKDLNALSHFFLWKPVSGLAWLTLIKSQFAIFFSCTILLPVLWQRCAPLFQSWRKNGALLHNNIRVARLDRLLIQLRRRVKHKRSNTEALDIGFNAECICKSSTPWQEVAVRVTITTSWSNPVYFPGWRLSTTEFCFCSGYASCIRRRTIIFPSKRIKSSLSSSSWIIQLHIFSVVKQPNNASRHELSNKPTWHIQSFRIRASWVYHTNGDMYLDLDHINALFFIVLTGRLETQTRGKYVHLFQCFIPLGSCRTRRIGETGYPRKTMWFVNSGKKKVREMNENRKQKEARKKNGLKFKSSFFRKPERLVQ